MASTKETLALADATSPSRITDYFNTRKTSGRRGGKKAKSKERLPAESSSVYLTPESSPSGTVDSSDVKVKANTDSLKSHHKARFMEPEADKRSADPHLEIQESGQTSALSECELSVPSTISKVTEPHDDTSKKPDQGTEISQTQPESAKHTDVPSISKDNPSTNTKGSKSTEMVSSSVSSTVPPCHTIDSVTASVTDSPSLPRPKVPKGSKTKSKSTVPLPGDAGSLKPKPGRRKKKDPEPVQKTTITDFFPVRRSSRQTKSEIEKEKLHQLRQQIKNQCEDGLQIKEFENKGRGIVATKAFSKGDFVVEYAGDLMDVTKARQLEAEYAKNVDIGCYMYFFMCGDKQYCVDATAESGRLGRLLNHSREGNCCTKSVMLDDIPRLILVAKQDIQAGEELTYDYGDRSKQALEAHPWLKL